MSIFARGEYGTSEIEYPLFKTLEYDNFQALVLRNSGQDWLKSSIKDYLQNDALSYNLNYNLKMSVTTPTILQKTALLSGYLTLHHPPPDCI